MTTSRQPQESGAISEAGTTPAPKLALSGCRGVSWSMILLAVVCFFLPWVKGCGNDFSGWEVVQICFNQPETIPISLYPAFLLASLIASLFYIGRRRPLVVMTAACLSAAGSLVYGVLFVLLSDGMNASPSKWMQIVQNTLSEFRPAYWISLTALLFAALCGWIEYRLRSEDQASLSHFDQGAPDSS